VLLVFSHLQLPGGEKGSAIGFLTNWAARQSDGDVRPHYVGDGTMRRRLC